MVFILNHDKEALPPCHEAEARIMLRNGEAAIWRKYPFTIILKQQRENENDKREYRLKVDYGSRYTGLAILEGNNVIWLAQIEHRTIIKKLMFDRRNYRKRRRYKNLRYRKAKFDHRTRPEGWLPPSLQSRVDNIKAWVKKLLYLCPITKISYENCKFDTQLMRDAEISGIEYQQGTLTGYNVREYILEKFERKCTYCGKKDIPLEVEHIVPKSRGGTDRVDNLCLACRPCNERKGTKTAKEFGYPKIHEQVKKTLKDCAIVNATRWKVYDLLTYTGYDVECGSGALTKMNRTRLGIAKDHHLDACCIGASTPDKLYFKTKKVLKIKAMGRGRYSRTTTDKYGFVKAYLPRQKEFFGFQTGDMVKAIVPKGKNQGIWYGRVACRSSGSFDIKTKKGKVGGVNWKCLKLIQKCDGYEYINANSSPWLKPGVSLV